MYPTIFINTVEVLVMIRILIAEDDSISRKILYKLLSGYGECDMVINGLEAIDAFIIAAQEDEPYDLICLDIMMPKVDGIKVLKTIRNIEKHSDVKNRVKIIMTTALNETDVVEEAFQEGTDAYAPKPLDINKLLEVIDKFGLIVKN